MQPKRKKIIRAKYLFLQDLEEEAPQMCHKDEERDGFTPYPMKFHSNRWAEKLGR
jgi:hypothetical protein